MARLAAQLRDTLSDMDIIGATAGIAALFWLLYIILIGLAAWLGLWLLYTIIWRAVRRGIREAHGQGPVPRQR